MSQIPLWVGEKSRGDSEIFQVVLVDFLYRDLVQGLDARSWERH